VVTFLTPEQLTKWDPGCFLPQLSLLQRLIIFIEAATDFPLLFGDISHIIITASGPPSCLLKPKRLSDPGWWGFSTRVVASSIE
jgi:hypothetical protein